MRVETDATESAASLRLIEGDATVGAVEIEVHDGVPFAFGWWVNPGKGHGAAMLYKAAIQWMRSQGYATAAIHVDAGNDRLADFYKRLGWEPASTVLTKEIQ